MTMERDWVGDVDVDVPTNFGVEVHLLQADGFELRNTIVDGWMLPVLESRRIANRELPSRNDSDQQCKRLKTLPSTQIPWPLSHPTSPFVPCSLWTVYCSAARLYRRPRPTTSFTFPPKPRRTLSVVSPPFSSLDFPFSSHPLHPPARRTFSSTSALSSSPIRGRPTGFSPSLLPTPPLTSRVSSGLTSPRLPSRGHLSGWKVLSPRRYGLGDGSSSMTLTGRAWRCW